MKIQIKIKNKTITVTMLDNPAVRDFVKLLPLTLTLDDYAHTEKVSQLPEKLSTTGSPSGADPSVGDISYYAPWGNLAIFYQDFGYAKGLIILGHIDEGIDLLNRDGPTSKLDTR